MIHCIQDWGHVDPAWYQKQCQHLSTPGWTTIIYYHQQDHRILWGASSCSKMLQLQFRQVLMRDHVTPLLGSLAIKSRIDFKILLRYKVLRGPAPSYLGKLIAPHQPNKTLYSSCSLLNLFFSSFFTHPANHQQELVPLCLLGVRSRSPGKRLETASIVAGAA